MKYNKLLKKFEINSEAQISIEEELSAFMEEIEKSNDENLLGEFFLALLNVAADIQEGFEQAGIEYDHFGSLAKKSLIENRAYREPTEEEKERNSKLN